MFISIHKKFILLLLTLVATMSLNAQNVQNKSFDRMLQKLLKGDVPTLSVGQVDSMQMKNKKIIFLDTREKREFDVSHIKNAIWVGYDEFSLDKLKGIDRNATIVNYCSVGARSEKITRKLQDEGFENAYNLYGSIFEWVNSGHKVVDSNQRTTERVHTYSKLWGVWLKQGKRVND